MEQPPRTQMLTGERARILEEACVRTSIHMGKQSRMLTEACVRMLTEARA